MKDDKDWIVEYETARWKSEKYERTEWAVLLEHQANLKKYKPVTFEEAYAVLYDCRHMMATRLRARNIKNGVIFPKEFLER